MREAVVEAPRLVRAQPAKPPRDDPTTTRPPSASGPLLTRVFLGNRPEPELDQRQPPGPPVTSRLQGRRPAKRVGPGGTRRAGPPRDVPEQFPIPAKTERQGGIVPYRDDSQYPASPPPPPPPGQAAGLGPQNSLEPVPTGRVERRREAGGTRGTSCGWALAGQAGRRPGCRGPLRPEVLRSPSLSTASPHRCGRSRRFLIGRGRWRESAGTSNLKTARPRPRNRNLPAGPKRGARGAAGRKRGLGACSPPPRARAGASARPPHSPRPPGRRRRPRSSSSAAPGPASGTRSPGAPAELPARGAAAPPPPATRGRTDVPQGPAAASRSGTLPESAPKVGEGRQAPDSPGPEDDVGACPAAHPPPPPALRARAGP
ncbi:basic proline-rich protein-like [Sorex araneus]|uniref:basic proline-rich protein-like n=1 Tax=Sorex araneus TaxID=42254 RepID=UPI002433DCAE|nr:basic proline-rich protein-like [Sorex araneus]